MKSLACAVAASALIVLSACDAIKVQPASTEPVAAEAVWQFDFQGSDKRTAVRDKCMDTQWQDLSVESRRVGCAYVAACEVVNTSYSWDESIKTKCAAMKRAPSSGWAKYTDVRQTLVTIYR